MPAKITARVGTGSGVTDRMRVAQLQDALADAVNAFRETYGRSPDWDNLHIRGGSTTVEVLIEIEEVTT